MDSIRSLVDAWVDEHQKLILDETSAVLQIPSVKDEDSVAPGAPFGAACADALAHTLALCERLGMRTQNFDGFAGHADFGPEDATETVAMLGHLDVVPPGSGWTVDPYGGMIEDGWIVSRGAQDDKGPTFAALFGAKAVMDSGLPLKRRIRLIFGCDEESGWECMAHYFGAAKQPMPTYAFTPDAGFPLYHAEKGSFTAVIRKQISDGAVVSFSSGLRPNMVPDEAEAVVDGGISRRLISRRAGVAAAGEGGKLRVTAIGKASHGAAPHRGLNAAVRLMRGLSAAGANDSWLTELANMADPWGAGVGIKGEDEITGRLTSNLGVVRLEGGVLDATFNVRYPSTWSEDDALGKFSRTVTAAGWEVVEKHHTAPLYVPLDAEPVKTLLRVYREHTGDRRKPRTMGGRTYATTVQPIGVAFGAAMKGDPEVAHRPDERFAVERLLGCAKIYGHALYALTQV